ncbi:hypothetical protein ILUMI_17715, partial [Ignelater luminosus]
MSDDFIETLGIKIMNTCPNTYIYSKTLAESIVAKEMDNIPIIIIRPSIVSPIWKDPIPGWTDNINGAAGIITAVGKGVLQTINSDTGTFCDFVPVDIVVNALIWSTYSCLNNNDGRIYNVCGQLPYTWKRVLEISQGLFANELPFNGVIWFPRFALSSYSVLHYFRLILLQYIPAACLDILSIALGRKARNWKFDNELLKEDSKLMNRTEMELYSTSVEGIDFKRYVYNGIRAIRLFVFNEKDETISQARIHIK